MPNWPYLCLLFFFCWLNSLLRHFWQKVWPHCRILGTLLSLLDCDFPLNLDIVSQNLLGEFRSLESPLTGAVYLTFRPLKDAEMLSISLSSSFSIFASNREKQMSQ